MVDALLLGCIPVLFHDGQPVQWPWHWGGWVQSGTMLLNQSAVRAGLVDPIATLAAVPERVARLQASIRKHAHRMHYSAVDTSALPSGLRGWSSPDAFEVILEGARRVARDVKLHRTARAADKGGAREMRGRQRRLAMAVGPRTTRAATSMACTLAPRARSGGGVSKGANKGRTERRSRRAAEDKLRNLVRRPGR